VQFSKACVLTGALVFFVPLWSADAPATATPTANSTATAQVPTRATQQDPSQDYIRNLYSEFLFGTTPRYSGLSELLYPTPTHPIYYKPYIQSGIDDYLLYASYAYNVVTTNVSNPQLTADPRFAELIKDGQKKLQEFIERIERSKTLRFNGYDSDLYNVQALGERMDFPVSDQANNRATPQTKLTALQKAQIKSDANLEFERQHGGRSVNPTSSQDKTEFDDIEAKIAWRVENGSSHAPQATFREQTLKEYKEKIDTELRKEKNIHLLEAFQTLQKLGVVFSPTCGTRDLKGKALTASAAVDPSFSWANYKVDEESGSILSADGKSELVIADASKVKFSLTPAFYGPDAQHSTALAPLSEKKLGEVLNAMAELSFATDLNTLRRYVKKPNQGDLATDKAAIKNILQSSRFDLSNPEKVSRALQNILIAAETGESVQPSSLFETSTTVDPHQLERTYLRWGGYPEHWQARESAAQDAELPFFSDELLRRDRNLNLLAKTRTFLSRAKAWGLSLGTMAAMVGIPLHIYLSALNSIGNNNRSFLRDFIHPISNTTEIVNDLRGGTFKDPLLDVHPAGTQSTAPAEHEALHPSSYIPTAPPQAPPPPRAPPEAPTPSQPEVATPTQTSPPQSTKARVPRANSGTIAPPTNHQGNEEEELDYNVRGPEDAKNAFYYLGTQDDLANKPIFKQKASRHSDAQRVILDPQSTVAVDDAYTSIPVLEHYQLDRIQVTQITDDGHRSSELTQGRDYVVRFDRSKGTYGIFFTNPSITEVRLSPELVRDPSQHLTPDNAPKALMNLDKGKLTAISQQLREAKLINIADALDKRIAADAPISYFDIRNVVAENSIYTHQKEMQGLHFTDEEIAKNPFLIFTKFVRSGIACGECNLGNALGALIEAKALPPGFKVTQIGVAVAKNGKIGSIQHVVDQIEDEATGKLYRTDATPLMNEKTLAKFQEEHPELKDEKKADEQKVAEKAAHEDNNKSKPSHQEDSQEIGPAVLPRKDEEGAPGLRAAVHKAVAQGPAASGSPDNTSPTPLAPDSQASLSPAVEVPSFYTMTAGQEKNWKQRWQQELKELNDAHEDIFLSALNATRENRFASLHTNDLKNLAPKLRESFEMIHQLGSYTSGAIDLPTLLTNWGIRVDSRNSAAVFAALDAKISQEQQEMKNITTELTPILLKISEYTSRKKEAPVALYRKAAKILGLPYNELGRERVQENLNLFSEAKFVPDLLKITDTMSRFAADHPEPAHRSKQTGPPTKCADALK